MFNVEGIDIILDYKSNYVYERLLDAIKCLYLCQL